MAGWAWCRHSWHRGQRSISRTTRAPRRWCAQASMDMPILLNFFWHNQIVMPPWPTVYVSRVHLWIWGPPTAKRVITFPCVCVYRMIAPPCPSLWRQDTMTLQCSFMHMPTSPKDRQRRLGHVLLTNTLPKHYKKVPFISPDQPLTV